MQMTITALSSVILAALTLTFWLWGRAALAHFRDLPEALVGIRVVLENLLRTPRDDYEIRFRDLEDAVERLPKKWEDIKRQADAAESRARYHVKRVRQELDDRGLSSDSVEQLADELRLSDGAASEEEGLQPVSAAMETTPETAAPINEDWIALANQKKFGGVK